MRHISPPQTALAVGTVVGLWHLIWVALVAAGWAKPVMDFILRLHFLNLQYSLAPYSATTGATLVMLTFTIGALLGLVFALIWNWLAIETAPPWARDSKHPTPAE
jgi:hypothetical protein